MASQHKECPASQRRARNAPNDYAIYAIYAIDHIRIPPLCSPHRPRWQRPRRRRVPTYLPSNRETSLRTPDPSSGIPGRAFPLSLLRRPVPYRTSYSLPLRRTQWTVMYRPGLCRAQPQRSSATGLMCLQYAIERRASDPCVGQFQWVIWCPTPLLDK